MRRRDFLASLTTSAAIRAQSQRQPNILILMYDKCRADAIGCYSGDQRRTPNLNALADTGMRFEHAYTPQSLCAPARASMLTGLYPHAHGMTRNPYPGPASDSHTNFPSPVIDPFRDPKFRLWDNAVFHLNNAGYATGCIGKWHLGPANPGFFDTFKAFNSLLRHWIGEPHRSLYRPDVETDEGIRFIESHADRPWFLYQSYYAPHEPLAPPKEWAAKFANTPDADYHATIANLDWNAGRIVETLRKRKLLDNTLIVFTSDHGRTTVSRPGRAEQGIALPYEEVARVPLILHYPSRIPRRTVWRSGVSLTALAPTIFDAANISLTRGLPGKDQTPSIQATSLFRTTSEADAWKDPIVIENISQAPIGGSFFQERAIRTARHKLILRRFDQSPEFRAGELYDLEADPGESVNVYSSQPRLVTTLASQLEEWSRRTQDNLGLDLARFAQRQPTASASPIRRA